MKHGGTVKVSKLKTRGGSTRFTGTLFTDSETWPKKTITFISNFENSCSPDGKLVDNGKLLDNFSHE